MKTVKISLADIQGKLSRNEMKNLVGGMAEPTTSCSCSLKSSGGASLTLPSDVTDQWTTEAECEAGCNNYCNGANKAGGDCANYSYQFTKSTITSEP